MPQLEFATFASQIFWLAVTFCILYLVIAKSTLPTIREVLQNRQERIAEDLKKAERLKGEAEAAEADFTSAIASARSRASTLLNSTREAALQTAEERHKELDITFALQAKKAGERVAAIRKETLEILAPIAVDAASDMLKKLIGVRVDKKKISKVAASFSDEKEAA